MTKNRNKGKSDGVRRISMNYKSAYTYQLMSQIRQSFHSLSSSCVHQHKILNDMKIADNGEILCYLINLINSFSCITSHG
jgi:hypothetical protein